MHAGKIDAVPVRLRQPDGIGGPVYRRLEGQDTSVRIEQRTEPQQLVGVVHGWKAHAGNLGESRRGLSERHQRSVEQTWIVALGRLGPLAIPLVVSLVVSLAVSLAVVLATVLAVILAVADRPAVHVAQCRPQRFPVESASRRWIGAQRRRAGCREQEAG